MPIAKSILLMILKDVLYSFIPGNNIITGQGLYRKACHTFGIRRLADQSHVDHLLRMYVLPQGALFSHHLTLHHIDDGLTHHDHHNSHLHHHRLHLPTRLTLTPRSPS